MLQRWLSTICVLALLSATSAQQPGKDKKAPKDTKPTDYFPLQVGNAWNYKAIGGGKPTTMRVVQSEMAGGQALFELETPAAKLSEHVSQTAMGVFRHRINGDDVTPPMCLIKYPATVGAKWDGEFGIGKAPAKHKYRGEIQADEAVDVPAGKYKALRVRIELEGEGQPLKTTYWFARDVGLVKQILETGSLSITLALEKLERKK